MITTLRKMRLYTIFQVLFNNNTNEIYILYCLFVENINEGSKGKGQKRKTSSLKTDNNIGNTTCLKLKRTWRPEDDDVRESKKKSFFRNNMEVKIIYIIYPNLKTQLSKKKVVCNETTEDRMY